jgi:hypothetical protein
MTFLIIHPITGDRAYADTRQGAEAAARTLRREATEQGCNPRKRCSIVLMPEEEQE